MDHEENDAHSRTLDRMGDSHPDLLGDATLSGKRAAYGQEFFRKYGSSVYFRVRKTWADKASQLGAFRVLQYAKQCADKNPGYAVFNESGGQIYPAEKA